MLGIRYVPCEHCGSPRDPNLARPCPLCRSRRYPLIGYSFQHEARTLMTMGLAIAGLLLLAVSLGAGVLIYLETLLSAL
jgi:disulfide bond formation protein DsbB